jgi:hypothetical protein
MNYLVQSKNANKENMKMIKKRQLNLSQVHDLKKLKILPLRV